MKKAFIPVVLLLSATFFMASCKKDEVKKDDPKAAYSCPDCNSTPEAIAANDGSSKGIYKGIVIGSSGTIKFAVQNGNNDIVATMTIDGTTVTLTSTVSWVAGQPYVAPFKGMMDGKAVSITFSVKADGTEPVITAADIPGHGTAVFTLIKETSNALLECFEGTYSTTKPEEGTFNILLSRPLGKWGGITRKKGANDKSEAKGTIANGEIKNEAGTTMCNLNGDVISGGFTDNAGSKVTIDGKRTR